MTFRSYSKNAIFATLLIIGLAVVAWPVLKYSIKSTQTDSIIQTLQQEDKLRLAAVLKKLNIIKTMAETSCTETTRQTLYNAVTQSFYISQQGWFTNDSEASNTFCSSHFFISTSAYIENRIKVSETLELGVVTIANRRFLAWLMRSEGRWLFVEPDFKMLYFYFNSICESCFHISFSLGPDLPPVSSFGETTMFRSTYEQTLASSKIHMTADIDENFLHFIYARTLRLYVVMVTIFLSIILLLIFSWQYKTQSRHLLFRHAIKKQQFIPYYQPVLDAANGDVVDLEVLIRWQKKKELIPPSEFIPFLESSMLIQEVTLQLIEQVIVDMRQNNGIPVSVNIPPKLIEDTKFVVTLIDLIHHHALPQHWLHLEITERQPITDFQKAKDNMEQLKALGIGFKLDDAGTGFGGFSYIQELPFDVLKIDRMFVSNIGVDSVTRSVIDEIIQFSRNVGVEIIAEGVENHDQSQHLLSKGVHYQQGYLFARPMPINALETWIATNKK